MAAIFVGEEPYSSDPAVSEWGNPVVVRRHAYYKGSRKVEIVICRIPPELKHLSRVRKRNTIEIPLVAASESGGA